MMQNIQLQFTDHPTDILRIILLLAQAGGHEFKKNCKQLKIYILI